MTRLFGRVACAVLLSLTSVLAQSPQKIGFIDSQALLGTLPESQDAKKKLETFATEWQMELRKKREALDKLTKEYKTKEILYTDDIKAQKQRELQAAEKDIADYQAQKFGANGEYFKKQSELMRPIQDRVFTAMKEVAVAEGYDYIFDRSSDTLLLYANEDHNLTQKVLDKLSALLPARSQTQQGGR